MKIFVGVTDKSWWDLLSSIKPDEINFWKPGGSSNFKAIEPGDLFLFKLHSPYNFIVGGGYFVRFSKLPVSIAWESFGVNNGVDDEDEFIARIQKYRRNHNPLDLRREPDPNVGCIILGEPFFLQPDEWIDIPSNWSNSIVQGKTYDTGTKEGYELYMKIKDRTDGTHRDFISGIERFGGPCVYYPRLGQGAFRVVVSEAYQRRCAFTGEKTLPVLDAAHIVPYSREGPHSIDNGLLLRKDIHKLFDKGYVTINKDWSIEVSPRLKLDFGNGRDYYYFQGKEMKVIPEEDCYKPNERFIEWHNNNVFFWD